MASELQRQHRTSLKEQSVQTITNNDLTWMNVQNPTRNIMQQLAEKYHFHELSIEDSLSKIEIPKIDKYAGSAGLPARIIYDTSFIPAFLQSFILFSNSCLMSSSLVVGDFRPFSLLLRSR